MLSEAIGAWKGWLLSWWSTDRRDSILELLDRASALADSAMPVVEAIDRELKPAMRTGHLPLSMTIEDFLTKHGSGVSSTQVAVAATRISALPTPDLLVNVALFLLERLAPKNAGISILRLAIELAYNVYKGTRDEAKVS